jgi:hypothetical protein
VAEQILQSPRLERQRILAFLERLENDPSLPGDYTEFDQTGRPNQVLLLGPWAVTYWADHAVREVRVVRLQHAG